METMRDDMKLSYPWLHDVARERFESDAAFEAFLPQALPPARLERKPDDRYLSAMTQRVFQAGVQHAMVDAKWPAFEEAFGGFVPEEMARLGPRQVDALMKDKRIIRDRRKIESVAKNAGFILAVREERGTGFGSFIAGWPVSDIIGLWQVLGKRGARLGGRSAPGFLRLAGKDTFFTTSDVVARLKLAGVIDREPGSQRALQAVQAAFNELHQASGRPLCQISAMLALSINPMF